MIQIFKLKPITLISQLFMPVFCPLVIVYLILANGIIDILSTLSIIEIIAILTALIFALYFMFIRKILIIVNYYKHDRKTIVKIDTDKEIIEYIFSEKSHIIHFSDIDIIYEYYGSGIAIQYYYKIILKDKIVTEKKCIICSYLLIPVLKKYLKNIQYIRKDCYNLFIPKSDSL